MEDNKQGVEYKTQNNQNSSSGEEKIISEIDVYNRLTLQEKSYVEQKVLTEQKKPAVAYLLWFFLGFLGAHRFYLGSIVGGIVYLVLLLPLAFFTFGVGTLLMLGVDLFLISGLLKKHNSKLRSRFALEVISSR